MVLQGCELAEIHWFMNLAKLKAVMECEGHLLFLWLINKALLCTGEGLMLCLPGICMNFQGHIALGAFGCTGVLLLQVLNVVYSPAVSRTWQTSLLGQMLILSLVHSPSSLLGLVDWLSECEKFILSVASHLLAFPKEFFGGLLRCKVWSRHRVFRQQCTC